MFSGCGTRDALTVFVAGRFLSLACKTFCQNEPRRKGDLLPKSPENPLQHAQATAILTRLVSYAPTPLPGEFLTSLSCARTAEGLHQFPADGVHGGLGQQCLHKMALLHHPRVAAVAAGEAQSERAEGETCMYTLLWGPLESKPLGAVEQYRRPIDLCDRRRKELLVVEGCNQKNVLRSGFEAAVEGGACLKAQFLGALQRNTVSF